MSDKSKSVLKNILYSIFVMLLSIGIMEIICRLKGLKPYKNEQVVVTCKPTEQGKLDAVLGYSWKEGTFVVTKYDTFSYTVNHNKEGKRFSALNNINYTNSNRKKVAILGCSFTYGDWLNDSFTHPYILQQICDNKNQDIRVENWGVGGYGPSQFYLQAQEVVKDPLIKYVVIQYASFQDERVQCSRSRRKAVIPNIKQKDYANQVHFPFFRETPNGLTIEYKYLSYQFLPFQKNLAVVEFIDNLYCRWENRNNARVSKKALEMILKLLQKSGKTVFLAGISGDDKTVETVKDFERKGYLTILYGINAGDEKYSLYPMDGHPNYTANKIFATKIYERIFEKTGQ